MLPMMLNQLQVTSATMSIPGKGVWSVDLDAELDPTGIVPTGPAVFTVGTKIFRGTIDEPRSGKFGEQAKLRLVGGGNGWGQTVPGIHVHNDVGVLSTAVYNAAAVLVGEVVVDVVPKPLGTDYVRLEGPASQVLAGVDWYVNELGITTVGPRIPLPFNPLTDDILEWDPNTRCATVAADSPVMPGTILLDLRFGTAIVRDVEQTFDSNGSRAKCWCDLKVPLPTDKPTTPGSRLVQALGSLAKQASGAAYLKRYTYRVALQAPDGRLTLAIDPLDILSGAPPFLMSVDILTGIAGATLKVTPGTQVTVAFIGGDPTKPVVDGFAPKQPAPLELSLVAARIALGPVAVTPVLRLTPAVLAWLASVGGGGTPGAFPLDGISSITFTD
jgi:hypothetical protein